MGRPRKNPDQDILIAVESGIAHIDGEECVVRAGVTRARRGHPLVAATPNWWKQIDVHYDVEKMTAAPGELRGEP